jgi:hypothetical protein
MKDELEIKNIRCLFLLFILLLTLFLPIANEKNISYSLLDFNSGKMIAISLFCMYIICLKNLKKIYLKIFSLVISFLFIYKIIGIILDEMLGINISTISLIIILMMMLNYISFNRGYKNKN